MISEESETQIVNTLGLNVSRRANVLGAMVGAVAREPDRLAQVQFGQQLAQGGFRIVARAGHGGVPLHAMAFHQAYPQAAGGGMVHGLVPSFAAYSHYTRRRSRMQDRRGLCLTCGIFVI